MLTAIVDRRLIALIAPAGYGKTSLLIDFASTSQPVPTCWYTLDRFDEDPWIFLGYLAASVAHAFPTATDQTIALLEGSSRNSFATAATTLVREIYSIAHDFVLILDDWHLVDHISDIRELIAQLVLNCPQCHLILASRISLGLPDQMLLVGRRQMIGIAEDELRFTGSEVTAIISAADQIALPLAQGEVLAEQLGGWITGILLLRQAMGANAPTRLPSGARAERQVFDFLAEQVFEKQAPDMRSFLQDTALIEELTPERCDAVLERSDSGYLLSTLLRNHLFITEIKPGVLRYHPLFREFLQEHFRTTDPRSFRARMRRVADAYANQAQWPLAFDSYIAANDLAAAQRIVAAGGEQLYTNGRLETIERWFDALPLENLDAPLLCLKARVLLDRGNHREAQVLADLAEARVRPGEEPMAQLLQAQLARINGRYEHAIEVAQAVLHMTQDAAQRAAALRMMAICQKQLGQFQRAIEDLNTALAIERQRGDLYTVAQLQHDLGICHEELGLLHAAEEYYSQADAYWATIGNMGLRAMSLNSKGVVQCMAGRYRDAHVTLSTALRHAQEAAAPDYLAYVHASLGDLYSDIQLWSLATEAYECARQNAISAYLLNYLDLAGIRMLVRQRQYEAALRALAQLPNPTAERNTATVCLLRGAIACGLSEYDRAAQMLDQAMILLEQNDTRIDIARGCILRAQIAAGRPPVDRAMLIAALDRAAQIADQLGHDAFLAAETLHIRGLLRQAYAVGWARASDWLQRHQEMHQAALALNRSDDRPLLIMRTLGTDQMILNGQPVDIGWLKAREVFYYLLAHPDGATPETLREAIWPELGAERNRGAKDAIYQLRSVLPRDLIELRGRQVYMINRAVIQLDYDVERFTHILTTRTDDPEALFEALDLYRGPYLPWSDNHWSASIRADLERRYLHALRVRAEQCQREGAYMDALILYTSLLAVDGLDESAHAGVMRCQIALGNRAAAISQYRDLRRILDEELGLDLDQGSEIEQLYYRIITSS
jgi:DNA-binding SARP family transcriptional activator